MNIFHKEITEHLSDVLDKRTNLRKGERKKVLLLQANIFIIISVLLILKPVFTSVMLSFHGVEIMPIAYGSIAVSAVAIHGLLNFMNRRLSLIRIITINHFFHIATLIVVSYLLHAGILGATTSIALYVYISLFALITVTYFYQYCQSLLTIRDAKRIYAYIGSGAIAGGVFGGYFTSVLIPYVGNSGLVLISALFLIISGLFVYELHRSYSEDTATSLVDHRKEVRTRSSFLAIKNPHVLHISMIIGLGVIVSKLVDYQFNYVAYQQITDEKTLTAFFGFWFSTINVIGLSIQVFLVAKIIDRVGVTKSIIIMPTLLLIGSGLLLLFPIMGFAIMVKAVEGSLKQSVYKTATEINIMPLGPTLRKSAKTLVDVVVDSLSTGMAGLIVYFLINKWALPFTYVGTMTIVVIGLWIIFVLRSKKTYTEELAKMVSGTNQDLQESERIGSTAKKFFLDDYLQTNHSENSDPRVIILELTRHEQTNVRKAAILRYVKDYKVDSIQDLIHCTEDPSFAVRKSVFFAMLMQTKNPSEVAEVYEGQGPTNKVIITAALAEAIGNNGKQKRIYGIHKKIDEALEIMAYEVQLDKSVKLYAQVFKAITISKHFERYEILEEAIRNSMDDEMQREALKAVAYGKAARLFDSLNIEDISRENIAVFFKVLAVFPNRLLARAKMLRGGSARYLNKYLPAFKFVDSQRHVDFLFELLDSKNLKTRRIALRSINESRKLHTHLNFKSRSNWRRLKREVKMLKSISAAITKIEEIKDQTEHINAKHGFAMVQKDLQRQSNRTMLNVFIYLSLITRNQAIQTVYNAIKSSRKDAALDYLDGILDYKLRSIVVPVLELIVNRSYTAEALRIVNQSPLSDRKMITLFRNLRNVAIAENYFEAMRLKEEEHVH